MIPIDPPQATRENSRGFRSYLIERIVRSDWKEIVAITATVTAICSLVAAILSGLAWVYSISFGALAIASILNWKLARSVDHSTPLPRASEELRIAETELHRAQQNFTNAANQMQEEREHLTHHIHTFHRENHALHQVNRGLRQVNHDLQAMCKKEQSPKTTSPLRHLSERIQDLQKLHTILTRDITQS